MKLYLYHLVTFFQLFHLVCVNFVCGWKLYRSINRKHCIARNCTYIQSLLHSSAVQKNKQAGSCKWKVQTRRIFFTQIEKKVEGKQYQGFLNDWKEVKLKLFLLLAFSDSKCQHNSKCFKSLRVLG